MLHKIALIFVVALFESHFTQMLLPAAAESQDVSGQANIALVHAGAVSADRKSVV